MSFALGCGAVGTLFGLVRTARRSDRKQVPGSVRRNGGGAPAARRYRVVVGEDNDLRDTATSVGVELANLSSAVEGHAQLVSEALSDPELAGDRADRLWTAVRRLRFFSEKILCSSHVTPDAPGHTDLRELFASVRHELEDHASGALKFRFDAADSLPCASAQRASLRNALLFLIETVLAMERAAAVLEVSARTSLDANDSPHVEIEIRAEADEHTAVQRELEDPKVHLGYVAARNLIHAQGGRLSFDHCPGLACTARVWLDPAGANEAAGPPPIIGPRRKHRWGGILILENDASLRAMIVEELRRAGRRVCPCPDAATAMSLLDITPERFELVIVEADSQLDPGFRVVEKARERCADARILLLASPTKSSSAPASSIPGYPALRKPFGVMELRDFIALELGTSMRSDAV